MKKYQLVIIKYLGYDNDKKTFIFEGGDKKYSLYPSEVSFCMPAPLLIQYMNERVNKLFKLLLYFYDYGYYAPYEAGNYVIYDGKTDVVIEELGKFKSLDLIPTSHNGKPIYKYRRKIILHELSPVR